MAVECGRLSKDTVKEYGRKIGKISHANPLLVFDVMIEQARPQPRPISLRQTCATLWVYRIARERAATHGLRADRQQCSHCVTVSRVIGTKQDRPTERTSTHSATALAAALLWHQS